MQEIKLPSDLEPRLQRRYEKLVLSHLRAASPLAAGVKSLPDKGKAFAATQGAWRFHNNERVTLPTLIEPLRVCGAEQVATTHVPFALLVHDWSKAALTHNADAGALTHERDVGYELTTALLVSADDGAPLAPMEFHCRTAEGLLSTRTHVREVSHVDQILPTMNASRDGGLSKPLLHVIDREADSVGHFRKWHAAGHKFLVRADDRQVLWNGQRTRLSAIRRALGRGPANRGKRWCVVPGASGDVAHRRNRGGVGPGGQEEDQQAEHRDPGCGPEVAPGVGAGA
jgi:hypothetical protein